MRYVPAPRRFLRETTFLALLAAAGSAAGQSVLRVAADGPARTFDPHAALDQHHLRIFAQIYEAPLECVLDAAGVVQVGAGLCDLPEVSADRKTLRLKVRPGARFHDDACFEGGVGRAVAAGDVVASLLRHADPATNSPAYELFVARRFVGVEAWREAAGRQRGADYSAPPQGVRAEGDVVVLELTEPYPALRALLTQPWASVVPMEAIRRYGPALGEHPVGSGPFRFAEQDAARLRFTRHAGYRLPGRPGVDELRFEIIPDLAARAARFAAGDLDVVDLVPATASRLVDARGDLIAEHKVKGRRIVDGPPLSVSYVAFNVRAPLFKTPAVRRAVGLALDRRLLAETLLGSRARRADGPLPPAFPEAAAEAPAGPKDGLRDVAAARAALKEAGFADPAAAPAWTLDFPSDVVDERMNRTLDLAVKQLREAGFKVEARVEPLAKFHERVASGDFAAAWTSWYADYPDAENFLQLFRSDAVGGAWDANYGRYADPEADRLYSDLAARTPGKERLATAGALLKRLRSDAPWTPIAFPHASVVAQRGLEGVGPNLLNWSFRDVLRK